MWVPIFRKNCGHFCIILALYAEHLVDTTDRISRSCRPVGDLGDCFYPVLSAVKLIKRDKNIVHHLPVVGQKERKPVGQFYYARKFHFTALQYLYHFTFLARSFGFGIYINLHTVAIKRVTKFTRSDEYVGFGFIISHDVGRPVKRQDDNTNNKRKQNAELELAVRKFFQCRFLRFFLLY